MKTLAAALTAGFLAVPYATIQAQPTKSLTQVCSSAVCVYDSLDRIVGEPKDYGMLWRKQAGTWYEMQYDENGLGGLTEIWANPPKFFNNSTFAYAKADCSDQPIMWSSENLPRNANYDLKGGMWAPQGPLSTFSWVAYSYSGTKSSGGTCVDYTSGCIYNGQTSCYGYGAPAALIATFSVYPPFKVQ